MNFFIIHHLKNCVIPYTQTQSKCSLCAYCPENWRWWSWSPYIQVTTVNFWDCQFCWPTNDHTNIKILWYHHNLYVKPLVISSCGVVFSSSRCVGLFQTSAVQFVEECKILIQVFPFLGSLPNIWPTQHRPMVDMIPEKINNYTLSVSKFTMY